MNKRIKFFFALFVPVLTICFFIFKTSFVQGANLTSVKDTLQSSRISSRARVDAAGTTVGGSTVQIKTTVSAPANTISTANFKSGDSVTVGSSTYTITDIIDSDEFSVTPVLAAGDADDNDPVYLKMKPRHVVTFTTVTAVPDGYFRILIPADTASFNDGNPDDDGFDFGGGSVDVTASTGNSNYTFVTGVATVSGGTACTSPANYHCFEVHYSGNGAIGASITINIGNTNGTNSLVAPAPTQTSPTHAVGTADTYLFKVYNFDAVDAEVDNTNGKIGLIESVRVTATVDPTITFSIGASSSGVTACGVTTDVTTTATSVPFGTLSLNTFVDGAQLLTVSTNAVNGYSVTAIENDQMSIGGLGATTIPDTTCDSGTCTSTSESNWATPTDNPGFGYSLTSLSGATVPFTAGGSFSSRPFDTTTPREVMSSTGVANSHQINVCYRISVDATQAAGDYENQITYTATATY